MSSSGQLLWNALRSAVTHVAPRIASALIFIVIGRLAGPADAGIFTLAITYLIIFTTLLRGLDELLMREVARGPESAARYLTNFLTLRFGLGCLSYGILWLTIRLSGAYSGQVGQVILVLGLSLVPESLAYTLQSFLMGQGDYRAPAIAWASVSVLRLAGGAAALFAGLDLIVVAWLWGISLLPMLVVLLVAAVRSVGGLSRDAWLDWRPLKQQWRASLAFLAITALLAIESQSDTVLLSLYRGAQEVGWYGAATTITMSLLVFTQGYRMAVFPLIVRYVQNAPQKLINLYERSARYLIALVLPMVVGLVLLAPRIVVTVFGSRFAPASTALVILAPILLCTFLNTVDVRVMYARDRQMASIGFLSVCVVINLSLNLLLDSAWGASGAAIARLCSTTVLFLLSHIYVRRHLLQVNLLRLMTRPALAVAVMAGAIFALTAQPLWLVIILGAFIYGVTLILDGGVLPEDRVRLFSIFTRQRAAKTP